jgi:hypothetical protein
LAMDSRAFLDELVCLHLYWGRGNNLESVLLISPAADLSDPVSPLQGADLQLLLRTQECSALPGDGLLTHLPFRSPEPTR